MLGRRRREVGSASVPSEGRGTPARSRLAVLGAVLLVTGLIIGGWVAWELYADPLMDPAAASQQRVSLRGEWASQSASPSPATVESPAASTPTSHQGIPGHAVALLRIPAFGASFEVPVVVGTTQADLARGVGWFNGTAAPGMVGNFAVVGHRGCCGPFVGLPDLHPGDRVIVETRDAIYTYVLDNNPADLTVMDTEGWVLDPVPGQPGAQPSKALITLITCAELFRSPERAVAFGHLVESRTT